MHLTTKGRYAVTAMLDVALNGNESPVSLSDISLRQGISLSYLEQLFSKLRKQGLVESVRGPGGGYRLDKNKRQVTVLNIIDAVNENVDVTLCQSKGNCHDGEICLTHHLWLDLSGQIRAFLNQVSLEDLISKRAVMNAATQQKSDKSDVALLNLPSD